MAFIKFVLQFLSNIGSTILGGYVLSILWGWFIVTTFGLPSLAITQAIGVSLVAGYLTHQLPIKNVAEGNAIDRKMVILWNWMKPLLFLLFGWIVHIFS